MASVYRALIPEVVRDRLTKAGRNLLFPGRLVNNLLQGKPKASGLETSRFLINIEHALHQLDRFYNRPLQFPEPERAERIEEIFSKVLYLSEGGAA